MKKNWDLTQESFDALLQWLDPQREQAGQKYEQIRSRLIKIFTCRGCHDPEDLADETINRVIQKLKEIESAFTGDRARYFYGVANKVHLEYLRKKPPKAPPNVLEATDNLEQSLQCLETCLDQLSQDNRLLALQYYQQDKQAKINQRKLMADQLGIAVNALRIRAYRIRAALQECVEGCLESTVR